MKKTSLYTIGLFTLLLLCFQGCKPIAKNIGPDYTGLITKPDLVSSTYTKKWFNPGYEKYVPDPQAMDTIKKYINDYKIVMFMGNWCPDSHRDVPKFYKILDEADYDLDLMTVYAMDEYKSTAKDYEKGLRINHIPTIIFYRDGKETNRFVEHARESLAKDIAKIVSGKPYIHSYKN